MQAYIHRVHYHETDKMGITHHSNYIKWMEEARIDFLDRLGYGYAALEREGIISPVIGVECSYKRTTTFDDEVAIRVGVEQFRGVRLTIGYTMTNLRTQELVAEGRTMHCFVDAQGKPVALKKQFPDFDRALKAQLEPSADEE